MKSPSKLSHIVLRTGQMEAMRDWYVDILSARIVFENPLVAFIAYDDEHHRIGLLNLGEADKRNPKAAGLEHIAFCYDNLDDLLSTFKELQARGIDPSRAINHGATTSIYYKDPDGNEVEFLIENFASDEEVNAFVASDNFRKTPHGRNFDPASYLLRLRNGESQKEIVTWTTE